MAPDATISPPTFAVRVELFVAGEAPASDGDGGGGASRQRRWRRRQRRLSGVISTVQMLQVRAAFASLLGLDEVAVAVTASPVAYEVRPDTALLVVVADFGRALDAAHDALLTLGGAMGSQDDAQSVLTESGLVLRSAPSFDVVESTREVLAPPFPLTLVIAAAASSSALLMLVCCCCILRTRYRGRSKVARLQPTPSHTTTSWNARAVGEVSGAMEMAAGAGSSSGQASTLRDHVHALQSELGVHGNMTEVVSKAAAELGIDPTGKSLAELARECMDEIQEFRGAVGNAEAQDEVPRPPMLTHTNSGTPYGMPVHTPEAVVGVLVGNK